MAKDVDVLAPIDIIDQTVEKWVLDFVHNSPLSRATDAWAHLYSILPQLKIALKEAINVV